MKKLIYAGVSAVVLLLAVVLVIIFTADVPLEKTISLKGYTINVPKDFMASSTGVILNGKAKEVGKFLLIDEDVEETEIPKFSGVSALGDVKTSKLTEKMKVNEFNSDKGSVVQYYVTDVPNPEPYVLSLTFYKDEIGDKLSQKIAQTLIIPEIGKNPPAKNILPPEYEDLDDTLVYKVTLLDGSIMVKNTELIDEFMEKQKKAEDASLEILSYVQSGMGLMEVQDWRCIESDSGRGFMYTYYDKGDGTYTYDNNPTSFESISKDALSEKGITSYNLKIGDAVAVTLLDVPMNLYRENLDELLSLKTDKSTVSHILKIFEKIMTVEQYENITVTKENDTVRIIYKDKSVFDRAKLSKDAAILFSLLSDVSVIEVNVADKEFYIIKRSDIIKGLRVDLNKAAVSKDAFYKFTEELENLAPAEPEINENEQKVLYSATVVIASGSKIKHPETGKLVVVDGYAEKYGFSYVLDNPIVCTVKKAGSIYIASATCEGTVFLSQTLETEAEALEVIEKIKEYS